ncbi:hypothetical protein AAK706_11910 [Erysipelotrichaceae bacterium 66-17]
MNVLIISIFSSGILCFLIGYFAGIRETKRRQNVLLFQMKDLIDKQDAALKQLSPLLDEKIVNVRQKQEKEK